MVINPLGVTVDPSRSKFRTTIDIAQLIYKNDGIRGFYRGYVASVCTYVPNSALWWTFYHFYQGIFFFIEPNVKTYIVFFK